MASEKYLKKLHEEYDPRFEQLLASVGEYTQPSDLDVLKKAYEFSIKAHKNQQRYSGKPYFRWLRSLKGLGMKSLFSSTASQK